MFYMFAIGLTFVLFPRNYFALFRPANAPFTPDELLKVGRIMLYLMAGWGLLDTLNIILSYALKGAGDTRFVMIYITLTGWLVLVPGSIILYRLGADIIQLWIWMAAFVESAVANAAKISNTRNTRIATGITRRFNSGW